MFTQIRLIIAGIVSTLLVLAYFYGRYEGKVTSKSDALSSYQEGVEKNAIVEKQANRMAESDLDRALLNWVQ